MLESALLDCAINEKCCSVDGGTGQQLPSRVPIPGNLLSKAKKC